MVEVRTAFDDEPFARTLWCIFGMCVAVTLIDGFDTGAIGFVAPSLLSEWRLQRVGARSALERRVVGTGMRCGVRGSDFGPVGRRFPLIGSVVVIAFGALSSAYARDLLQLTALRFVTGIGLGAALPNAVTIMSEFGPDSRRATLTNLMSCGFPLGTALGGFFSAWLIPDSGWQACSWSEAQPH